MLWKVQLVKDLDFFIIFWSLESHLLSLQDLLQFYA